MQSLSVIVRFPHTPEQTPCMCGLTKMMEGSPPSIGWEFELDFRPKHIPLDEFLKRRPGWLPIDGMMLMRVARVRPREIVLDSNKPSTLSYQIGVEPVTMTLEQLQEFVTLGWAKICGWRIIVDEGTTIPK